MWLARGLPLSGELLSANGKELMRRTRAANCKQFERRLQMSTQEIIRELTKLNRDELAQVDLKLHELLEEKIGAGGRSWGEALLEVAGTVEVCHRITRRITIIIFSRVDEGLRGHGSFHRFTQHW
jgi:hypothetical protein